MVFVETDSFRNLRRPPTDAFRSIPRLPREALSVAASDLVAWYPSRSGTGEDLTAGDSNFGDTTDYSATVNGATFQASGGVTDIQTGANSGVFEFDGTDDTLDLGTVADSDQSLTIMAWVSIDQFVQNEGQRILTKNDGNTFPAGRIALDIKDPNSNPRVFVGESNTATIVTDGKSLSVGVFEHIAGRYDFGTGELAFFRNGQKEAQDSVGQLPPLASQPWRIGADNPAGKTEFLDGTVDGVRIYQSALADSQINQIYQNTQP